MRSHQSKVWIQFSLWLVLLAVLAVFLLRLGRPDTQTESLLVPAKRQVQPVELVLLDGRPDPTVLAEEQVLHKGNGEEPQTLDPHLAEGVPSSNILRDLFEGLVGETADGQIAPGAAERWNVSRDGKIYTFSLRRNARWSNGDPVTAEDFVFSLRRSADPATASNYAQVLAPILNAEAVIKGEKPVTSLGVKALDRYTVQIKLNAPTPYFLGLLTHSSTYPVHRPSVEAYGQQFSRPGHLVSNGAYQLRDWVVRSFIQLEKNPEYWDADNVYITEVFYYPTEDNSSELKRYRAHELHWTEDVPNSQFDWLKQHYPDELVIAPWLGSYYFGFNLRREPFKDKPKLRQALALVVDRDLLVNKLTKFGEKSAYTLVPQGIGEYQPQNPAWAEWSQAERNAEAQRLYAEAGYGPDKPLRVEIRYNTSENHKKIALVMAAMWKDVLGVDASLVNEEWKVFLQNRSQGLITQIYRAGWIGDFNDPASFLELFHSEHGKNDAGYVNESYDQVLAAASAERIPSRRRRLLEEAERILAADQVIIPLYTYVVKRLIDPHLGGWQANVMDHHYSKHMYLLRSQQSEAEKNSEVEIDEAAEPVTPEPVDAG